MHLFILFLQSGCPPAYCHRCIDPPLPSLPAQPSQSGRGTSPLASRRSSGDGGGVGSINLPLGRRSGEHPLFSHPSATAEHPPLLPSEAARQPVQVFSPNESHEAPSVMVWTPDYFGAGVVHQVWGARCGGGSVMVWTPGSLGRADAVQQVWEV